MTLFLPDRRVVQHPSPASSFVRSLSGVRPRTPAFPHYFVHCSLRNAINSVLLRITYLRAPNRRTIRVENNSEQSDGKKRNYRNKKIEKKKKLNKIADLKTKTNNILSSDFGWAAIIAEINKRKENQKSEHIYKIRQFEVPEKRFLRRILIGSAAFNFILCCQHAGECIISILFLFSIKKCTKKSTKLKIFV